MPKLAVLGKPVAHSRSPAMHTAALEAMGLAGEWSYNAVEVAPEDFEARVRAMAGEGYAGANVTVPHKLAALFLADEASEAAREIGAANTLTLTEARIEAENTDAEGILAALPESPSGKRALVLGAGGSARAAIWALKRAGGDVSVWNRTPSKAESLARELGVTVVAAAGTDAPLAVHEFQVLVNATTVGLRPPESGVGADPERVLADLKSLRLRADAIQAEQIVVDLVYGAAETPLASTARSRGASVVDGLDVLVHQGAASLRLWTGMDPPIETMERAARGDEPR